MTFEAQKIPFFSKLNLFDCSKPCETYECATCNHAVHEKTVKLIHNCAIEIKSEVTYYQCKRCNVGSFSFAWRYFHENRRICDKKSSASHSSMLNNLKRRNIVSFKANQAPKQHQCDQCGFRTMYKSYLKRHMIFKHSPDQLQNWFQCDFCDYKSRNKYHITIHKKVKHTPIDLQKWLHCDQCKYKSKQRIYLQRHKRIKHTLKDLQKWWNCDKCDYKARQECNLIKHKIVEHNFAGKQKWLNCDQCEYKTAVASNLRRHKNCKHNSIDLQELCKLIAQPKCNLTQQQSNQTETQFRFNCDQCEYKANRIDNLKRHKSCKHTSDDCQKWFECDKCEYKAKQKDYLKIHKNTKHKSADLQSSDQYEYYD